MNRLRDSVHIRQFVKFGIVGLGNTGIDFGLYIIGTRFFHLHYLAANTLSWICAVCFSFTMNKFWTFRAVEPGKAIHQYGKFVAVSIGSLVISLGVLHFFIDVAQFHDILAKILTIGIIVFWNFFLNKFWTFSV